MPRPTTAHCTVPPFGTHPRSNLTASFHVDTICRVVDDKVSRETKSRRPKPGHGRHMPQRNLIVIMLAALLSMACYVRASRNRYVSTLTEAMNIISSEYVDEVEPRKL